MSFRSSRGVLTAALSLVTLAASPAVASAEVESPVQGESSNGLFLSYAPKSDDEGAVCFVDSGIDENPDTEDAIIERTSVAGDGSSGEDVDKVILLALGGSDSPSGRGGGGGSSGGSGGGGSGGGGSSSEGPSAGPPALTPALFAVSSARLSRGRLLVAGRPGGRPSARLVLLPPRPPHAACGAHS